MRSLLAVALLLVTRIAAAGDELAVLSGDDWKPWWQSESAPLRWTAPDSRLTGSLEWRRLQPGLETAELRIAARTPAVRIQLVLLRIDPQRFDWRLVERFDTNGRPSWEAESAPPDAAFALNAGQFASGRPWGWLVVDGREVQRPGYGPLSMAVVIDSTHAARLVPFGAIEAMRGRTDIAVAFQSYPVLLEGDGDVPEQLRMPGRGVDLDHRDSRLAIGALRDGRLLVVLTRFDIGGGLLRPVPIGPDTPEMAAIMGALGCRTAVMLDGGLSSQLLARDTSGATQLWSGYRWVPLGLVAVPRKESAGAASTRVRPQSAPDVPGGARH